MVASPDGKEGWCYLHMQYAMRCTNQICRDNAGDKSFNSRAVLETDVVGTIGDLPDAPMSPAEATGIEFFSIYSANLKAGFSPPQSLYLLAVQISGNPGIAPGFEEPDPRNI